MQFRVNKIRQLSQSNRNFSDFSSVPLSKPETLYRRVKLLEHLILIVVTLLLNILLSWAFVTSLNCSVICKPPRRCECYFRRSKWIHCWLLLAVLSDFFDHLVSSTILLCKFWGLTGSTADIFPFMRRWKCLGLKWSSHPMQVAQLSENGLRKHAETEAESE